METCVRGFSYMPEIKAELNLQYVEDEELDRTWKVSRRQRAKDQEQRIWEEFVKEQDIVHTVCNEDPYQFLHELPENCLKELMEEELVKMKNDQGQNVVEQPDKGEGERPHENQAYHTVTFAEDDKVDANMDLFHIFDDDNDFNQSDVEVECEDDTMQSPDTVRERADHHLDTHDHKPDVAPGKSEEAVSNVIESSIYCAKLKDIRIKIGHEMVDIMASLEGVQVTSLERSEVRALVRRAAQFAARFNRIYMYQLQTQAHNIKRQVCVSLPHAQHTQFQSQMLRVVSLHQNMLQAAQVLHKSIPATLCSEEWARALTALCAFVRDATALCRALPTPREFVAAEQLYDDDLLQTCDRLDVAINEYNARVARFISSSDMTAVPISATSSTSKTRKTKPKKNTFNKTVSKTLSNKDTDARLSMYSLDTLRLNLHSKSTGPREHSGSTSRGRASPSAADQQQTEEKNNKKSGRRPLMRAPNSGPTRRRTNKHTEVTTMVETIGTCLSSQAASRVGSPLARTPRRNTPRNPSPRRKQSPNLKTNPSPKRKTHPKQIQSTKSLTNVESETAGKTQISPIAKIQCDKKTNEIDSPKNVGRRDKSKKSQILEYRQENTGKNTDRSDRSRSSDKTEILNTNRSESNNNNKKSIRCIDKSNAIDKNSNKTVKKHDKINPLNPKHDLSEASVVDSGKISVRYKSPRDNSAGKEYELTDGNDDYSKNYAREVEEQRDERRRAGIISSRSDVKTLLRQLCSGDPSGVNNEKVTGAKNAQLVCIRGGSPPNQPTTPQLLRILEETIPKQVPKPMYEPQKPKNLERFRMNFNIGEATASRLFQYRTKFVQHMLTSPLYANSAVGKPWEMIGGVSDKIIDELLTCVAKEMEVKEVLSDLYRSETN